MPFLFLVVPNPKPETLNPLNLLKCAAVAFWVFGLFYYRLLCLSL